MPETYADIVACLPASVVRFVKHDGTVTDLTDAIRAAGGVEVGRAPIAVTAPTHCLTARELEILRHMQQGLCNKTISRQLGIELSTVKNHVHSVLAKLGVRSRSEAISLLYRQGKPAPDWDAELLDERAMA
jgi:two-component system nitrate/nitrite response regulator NarL